MKRLLPLILVPLVLAGCGSPDPIATLTTRYPACAGVTTTTANGAECRLTGLTITLVPGAADQAQSFTGSGLSTAIDGNDLYLLASG